MIGQNEVNVQGELANKTDNGTVSCKHRTGRILVQIKYRCLHDHSIPESSGETHLKNRYLNLSAILKFAKTQNEQNQLKRGNATHN